jgi:hypothetical protein
MIPEPSKIFFNVDNTTEYLRFGADSQSWEWYRCDFRGLLGKTCDHRGVLPTRVRFIYFSTTKHGTTNDSHGPAQPDKIDTVFALVRAAYIKSLSLNIGKICCKIL